MEIPVSQWLSEHDAWTIYDAEKILTDLHERTVCGVVLDYEPRMSIITYPGGKNIDIYHATESEIRHSINARGLGGDFDPGDCDEFIVGWAIAINLRNLITDKHSTKSGRGFAFREAIEHIKEAENAKGL